MKYLSAGLMDGSLRWGTLICYEDCVQFQIGNRKRKSSVHSLSLYYRDMEEVERTSERGIPPVRICMKNREVHTFLVFGSRSLVNLLREGMARAEKERKIL